MGRFRNISDDTRAIPAAGVVVPPDGLFTVPDDLDAGFEAQPWFAPAPAPIAKKGDA